MSSFLLRWGDKLFVVYLAMMFCGMYIFGEIHHDSSLMTFSSDITKMLTGAFLALVTGDATSSTGGNK